MEERVHSSESKTVGGKLDRLFDALFPMGLVSGMVEIGCHQGGETREKVTGLLGTVIAWGEGLRYSVIERIIKSGMRVQRIEEIMKRWQRERRASGIRASLRKGGNIGKDEKVFKVLEKVEVAHISSQYQYRILVCTDRQVLILKPSANNPC
jgi:hypothetical protein